jgi:hypothetical protein
MNRSPRHGQQNQRQSRLKWARANAAPSPDTQKPNSLSLELSSPHLGNQRARLSFDRIVYKPVRKASSPAADAIESCCRSAWQSASLMALILCARWHARFEPLDRAAADGLHDLPGKVQCHSASSTVIFSGPYTKTRLRLWKSIILLRSRTPAAVSFAISALRSSTAKQM